MQASQEAKLCVAASTQPFVQLSLPLWAQEIDDQPAESKPGARPHEGAPVCLQQSAR
jgi:hypothetical protein